jgi:hypothetical protein
MGSIIGLRLRTQARAIWLGAAPDLARLPAASGNQGMKPMLPSLTIIQHVFTAAIDEIVAVLHGRHFEYLRSGFNVLHGNVA